MGDTGIQDIQKGSIPLLCRLLPALRLVVAHEAFGPVADEVGAPGAAKRLKHELSVLGVSVLDKRSLHGLLVWACRAVDRLIFNA